MNVTFLKKIINIIRPPRTVATITVSLVVLLGANELFVKEF